MYKAKYMAKWRKKNNKKIKTYMKRWRRLNRDKMRNHRLKRNGGFTLALFVLALRKQKNRCGICRRTLRGIPTMQIHADHCHRTRKPRGVLCQGCNTGIGWFQDNPKKLKQAIAYLKKPTLRGNE